MRPAPLRALGCSRRRGLASRGNITVVDQTQAKAVIILLLHSLLLLR